MLAVAQDVRGADAVAPIAAEYLIEFPVLLDTGSALARLLGFRVTPSGFFVDDGTIHYRHVDDFDFGDPRDRANLTAFLAGDPVDALPDEAPMEPRALDLFARGAAAYAAGDPERALETWREALALDPDNFLIRSQIWTVEHPERFWPVVDRQWQEQQLLREGYDKPLP